jgi:hypothetical protein
MLEGGGVSAESSVLVARQLCDAWDIHFGIEIEDECPRLTNH